MSGIIFNVVIVIVSFVTMEGVAWFTHKYIMHGFLWSFHRDHHKKDTYGFFEHNDIFFLIFAIPGMAGLLFGLNYGNNFLFYLGLGITFYGLAYFLVHEIFIHQRLKYFKKTNIRYFKAIRRAHKIHHKNLEKENGECFGMLWVPIKYFREQYK